MKAELFLIKGSIALLKAIMQELVEVGYENLGTDIKGKFICQGYATSTYDCTDKKDRFINIGIYDQSLPKFEFKSTTFELPSQYNEALAFAKAQLAPTLWEEPKVKLPFANLTFTVNKSKSTATCEHGTITKAEIKAVIDAVVSPKARLLGYDLETFTPDDTLIKFGCQRGVLSEAQAILKALE